jgi:autotransporter adhesin
MLPIPPSLVTLLAGFRKANQTKSLVRFAMTGKCLKELGMSVTRGSSAVAINRSKMNESGIRGNQAGGIHARSRI